MASRGVREEWRALCAGLLAWLASALPIAALASQADAEADRKQIAGWVERLRILPSNALVRAKLDTGAKTSSIHAEDIERFEREGRTWVRYTLVLKETRTKVHRVPGESLVVRKVYIKEHESRPDARPVVELDFCMDGRRHRAQFSLADRSAFLYSILLGRDFLAGSFVVDPDATFLTGASCDPETEAP
ncbi:MAG: RimK/LysX family protein [Myxococcota bacterium]